MNLIFLRHGEIHFNKIGFLGSTDLLLTERGIKQSEIVAERLKEKNIEKIYSSPLSRCIQTAKIIAEILKLKGVTPDERLREVEFGIFEGLSLEEANEKYPEIYKARIKDKWNFRIPRGESYSDAAKRLLEFTKEIENKRVKVVLCVTHVTVIKVALKVLCDLDLRKIEEKKYLPTCFVELKRGKEKWKIVDSYNISEL
jgi:broad specificity phosphatase PhoE